MPPNSISYKIYKFFRSRIANIHLDWDISELQQYKESLIHNNSDNQKFSLSDRFFEDILADEAKK